MDENLRPVSPGVVRGQIQWLKENVQRADAGKLALPEPRLPEQRIVYPDAQPSPIRAFCDTHPIRDVVEQVVPLSRNGTGHCPHGELHKQNDRHKSFIVYEKSQKFWCFTCRRGGNAADFIMWTEGIDAKEFVKCYCCSDTGSPQAALRQLQR